jgi:competence ComEA-like helix-hairpin-helix protein
MWKDWLAFSRREQYGIIALIILILLLVALRILLPFFDVPQRIIVSNSDNYYKFDSAEIRKKQTAFTEKSFKRKLNLQVFNPNKVSVTLLHKMGLPSHVIVNWMKYLESGGRFYSSSDVSKIYGLDSATVKAIQPFLSFKGDNFQKQKLADKNSGRSEPTEKASLNCKRGGVSHTEDRLPRRESEQIIEINGATVEDFKQLAGIGDVLSKRIVAFRQALGGFYKVHQIKEVYGISNDMFQNIRGSLVVKGGPTRLIDINHVSLRTLKAHPYINFYQARDIVEYRKENAEIESSEVLKTFASFDEQSLEKLLPYVSFGDK